MPAAGDVVEFVAKDAVAVGGEQMQQQARGNDQGDHGKTSDIPADLMLAVLGLREAVEAGGRQGHQRLSERTNDFAVFRFGKCLQRFRAHIA